MIRKNEKIIIFMNFYAILLYVCERKIKLCRYFTCQKLKKNDVKKHVKTGKSGNFQKVPKSSIRLEITF